MRTNMTGTALSALLVAGLAGTALAGEIDTLPGIPLDFPGPLGAVTRIGGTFVADDSNLAAFTLVLGDSGTPVDNVVGLVLATIPGPFPPGAGGVPGDGEAVGVFDDPLDVKPVDPPLWMSAPVAVVGGPSNYTFTPNVALTPGLKYWIGIDVAAGGGINGSIDVGLAFPPAPASAFVFIDPPGEWLHEDMLELANLIVMNPEPGSAALFGIGLLGAALGRRRRRRAVRA